MIPEEEITEHLAELTHEELIEQTLEAAQKIFKDARRSPWWLSRYVLELDRRGFFAGAPAESIRAGASQKVAGRNQHE